VIIEKTSSVEWLYYTTRGTGGKEEKKGAVI